MKMKIPTGILNYVVFLLLVNRVKYCRCSDQYGKLITKGKVCADLSVDDINGEYTVLGKDVDAPAVFYPLQGSYPHALRIVVPLSNAHDFKAFTAMAVDESGNPTGRFHSCADDFEPKQKIINERCTISKENWQLTFMGYQDPINTISTEKFPKAIEFYWAWVNDRPAPSLLQFRFIGIEKRNGNSRAKFYGVLLSPVIETTDAFQKAQSMTLKQLDNLNCFAESEELKADTPTASDYFAIAPGFAPQEQIPLDPDYLKIIENSIDSDEFPVQKPNTTLKEAQKRNTNTAESQNAPTIKLFHKKHKIRRPHGAHEFHRMKNPPKSIFEDYLKAAYSEDSKNKPIEDSTQNPLITKNATTMLPFLETTYSGKVIEENATSKVSLRSKNLMNADSSKWELMKTLIFAEDSKTPKTPMLSSTDFPELKSTEKLLMAEQSTTATTTERTGRILEDVSEDVFSNKSLSRQRAMKQNNLKLEPTKILLFDENPKKSVHHRKSKHRISQGTTKRKRIEPTHGELTEEVEEDFISDVSIPRKRPIKHENLKLESKKKIILAENPIVMKIAASSDTIHKKSKLKHQRKHNPKVELTEDVEYNTNRKLSSPRKSLVHNDDPNVRERHNRKSPVHNDDPNFRERHKSRFAHHRNNMVMQQSLASPPDSSFQSEENYLRSSRKANNRAKHNHQRPALDFVEKEPTRKETTENVIQEENKDIETEKSAKTVSTTFHAISMLFIWFVCVPNAIFITRYFDETHAVKIYHGKSLTYVLHVVLLVVAFILMAASVSYSFWEFFTREKAIDLPQSNEVYIHVYLGITSSFLLGSLLLFGWLARHQQSRKSINDTLCCFAGISAYSLALIMIWRSYYVGMPCATRMICFLWITWSLSANIIMCSHFYWLDTGRPLGFKNYFRAFVRMPVSSTTADKVPIGHMKERLMWWHFGGSCIAFTLLSFLHSIKDSKCANCQFEFVLGCMSEDY